MRPSHLLILLIIALIIFGASKLPDLARNLGKSAKILKKEMRELVEDEDSTKQTNCCCSNSNKDSQQESKPASTATPTPNDSDPSSSR